MKSLIGTIILSLFGLSAMGCMTRRAAEPAPARVKATAKVKTPPRGKESVTDFSFGTQSDYDSPMYNEGRRNRYSIAFD